MKIQNLNSTLNILPKPLLQLAKKYHRAIKFAMVGVTNVIFDFIFYKLFIFLLLNNNIGQLPLLIGLTIPAAAKIFSTEIVIVWSFFANSKFTFKDKNHKARYSHKKKFLIFQFVSLGGLLFSQNSLFIFNRIFNIFDLIAKALTIPMVASFNYLVNSRWTFRDIHHGRSTWQTYIIFILALFALYFLLIL